MSKPAKIQFTVNDEKPDLYPQLYNRATGIQLDLSDSNTTVTALFRSLNNLSESEFAFSVTKHVASLGIVKLSMADGDLDIDDGRYQIEITVDFNGAQQTVIDIFPVSVRKEFPAVA